MTKLTRVAAGTGVLATLLLLAPHAVGQATPAAPSQDEGMDNVLLTVRMGKLEGNTKVPVKSYSLVVAAGSVGSKLLSGARVPIPAVAEQGEGSGDGERVLTSYTYQNVGFVTEAKAWIVDKKHIRLMANIEDSRVLEGAEGEPPTVETRSLNVSAVLTDGVPLELTRVEGVTDLSGFVEVVATILE